MTRRRGWRLLAESRARESALVLGGGESRRGDSGSGQTANYDVETGRTDLPDWWPQGWRNRLIWGDNKLVLSSLLDEFAGKVDLIYIDPPFAIGADFSYRTRVGDNNVNKEPSMLEEMAYRDMWSGGLNSYIPLMQRYIQSMYELLKPTGSIYLHCDHTANSYLRACLDEIFGENNFQSEISWLRKSEKHNLASKRYPNSHDTIYFYVKSPSYVYNIQYSPYDDEYIAKTYSFTDSRGRYTTMPCTNEGGGNKVYEFRGISRAWRFSYARMNALYENDLLTQATPTSPFRYKIYLDDAKGVKVSDFWDDVNTFSNNVRTGYPTQKPEALLERIIKASSNQGGLVLDCFVGSGTTSAVAENLGRRWIGVDIGRFAIQTTRKRLLDIPGCRPFEVQNLGRYERSHWQDIGSSGGNKVAGYIGFILDLYRSQPILGQFQHLHGIREGVAVHVGATDAPVSADELRSVVAECTANGFAAVDVLGWEWEMGLNPALRDELRQVSDVGIRLLNIPREILDQRNIDAGAVNFFELSVADARIVSPYEMAVHVELSDFIPAVDEYMQQRLSSVPTKWSDWIDYWSVDFEFDGEIFVNQWQSYRTRRDRSLKLVSDPYEYSESGPKAIVVKVIDIFGNDTTVELDHEVGGVS